MHTFTFTVPLSFHELTDGEMADPRPKTWLAVGDGETANETEAARFTFRTHTTYGDDLQAELALDELTGGVGSTVDLQRGVDNAFTALAAAAKLVWTARHPDSQEVPSDEQLNSLINECMQEPSTPQERQVARVAAGFERMQLLLDNLRVAALWPILAQQVPAGWEDFATKPLADRTKARVVTAFKTARAEAQKDLGK